jgi:hypothetical protein
VLGPGDLMVVETDLVPSPGNPGEG